MMKRFGRWLTISTCGLSFVLAAYAQGNKTPGTQGSSAAPTPAGLSGLSYALGDWETKMPTDPNMAMLCYKLVPTTTASQPFTLEPTVFDCNKDKNNKDIVAACTKLKRSPCSLVDNTHPLLQRQLLVLAIDTRQYNEKGDVVSERPAAGLGQMAVLNFNVTTQAGIALTPTPVRPSLSAASVTASGLEGAQIFYFRWPIQLIGDTVPTVTVNTVYKVPAPGDRWQSNTLYSPGSVVTPVPADGHFYTAMTEGRFGSDAKFKADTPKTVQDPDPSQPRQRLVWMDLNNPASRSAHSVCPLVSEQTVSSGRCYH